MNEPISMWSGAIPCVQPRRLATPWTVITLEPTPSMWAPIAISMRARSWTCGSEAALRITVGPRVRAAAISAFSVAITEGSSIRKSHGLQAERSLELDVPAILLDGGAEGTEGIEVRVEPPAADHIATRRGHLRPPEPGQERAREQERGADALGQLLVDLPAVDARAVDRDLARASHWTRAPSCSSSSVIASTSRIRGTLRRITSSSVSRHAARMGSAPFLLPAGTIVPDRGTPPSITNFSIGGRSVPCRVGGTVLGVGAAFWFQTRVSSGGQRSPVGRGFSRVWRVWLDDRAGAARRSIGRRTCVQALSYAPVHASPEFAPGGLGPSLRMDIV